MNGLCIKSDFIDYYDKFHNPDSIFVYNRFIKDSKQRGTELKYLRTLGIETIEIKQVNQYCTLDNYLVVYMDPYGHNGKGKRIMSFTEAMEGYSNCLASKYIDETNVTLKYLQIGERRFNIWFQKEKMSLSIGKIVDIQESFKEFNILIGEPIYSIDYITYNNKFIATDFNRVENLSSINIQNYLSPEDVVLEIQKALKTYNLI